MYAIRSYYACLRLPGGLRTGRLQTLKKRAQPPLDLGILPRGGRRSPLALKPEVGSGQVQQGQNRDIQGIDVPTRGGHFADFFTDEIDDLGDFIGSRLTLQGELLAENRYS